MPGMKKAATKDERDPFEQEELGLMGNETPETKPMFDELTSESKRCLVLLASFVVVMPLGFSRHLRMRSPCSF